MLQMLKSKWVSIPSVAFVVLLVLAQAGFSWYRTAQAEAFVTSIRGIQAGPVEFHTSIDEIEREDHADLYIRWDYTPYSPPNCPVTVVSRLLHEDGLSLIDGTAELIPAAFFKEVHVSKNGHLSIDPIYSHEVAEVMQRTPGEWQYILAFKFHCSIVNSEWISFLKFDRVFEAHPVIITIE